MFINKSLDFILQILNLDCNLAIKKNVFFGWVCLDIHCEIGNSWFSIMTIIMHTDIFTPKNYSFILHDCKENSFKNIYQKIIIFI